MVILVGLQELHVCLLDYKLDVLCALCMGLGFNEFRHVSPHQYNSVCRPTADSILMPPTFPIASLNRYTPNFSGVPQKLTWCQQFGLQIFPKWGDADFLPPKNAVFRCFFGLNKFSRPNGQLLPTACHTYLESYNTQLSFGLSGNYFCASHETSEFCWQIALNFLQRLRPCHM